MTGVESEPDSEDCVGRDVNTAELRQYLSEELGVAVTGITVIDAGLNLVLGVETANAAPAYVLRRPNKLRDTPLFIDIEQEYGVLKRLGNTPVPTPNPVLFCDDDTLLGDSFYVMTHHEGEPVPLGSELPARFRTPSSRRRAAELVVETLAEVHSVETAPFEAVCERRTAREQVERDIERLDAATSVTGHEVPTLRAVGEWLRANAPAESGTTLVHGDFRPGNVLFAGDDRLELTAVLDWETTMLGDPLTELGYLLLRWRDADDPTPSLDGIAARHPERTEALEHLREVNENGLAPFTAKPGSPGREELVSRYEATSDIRFRNERFYVAQAAFGLATVWEDLHRHRTESGEESEWEPHIEYLAKVGECILDGAFPL